jgi:bifunctional DNase/RNase
MEIQTVVFGGMQMASLVVLHGTDDMNRQVQLPIRIGPVEAAAITSGIEGPEHKGPRPHDRLANTLDTLGARLASIEIVDVKGTTFYARLKLIRSDGSRTDVDCRPSDGIALAVRTGSAIYVHEQVLDTATMPDFHQVEADAQQSDLDAFHDFVESLSPEDFE